MIGRKYAGLLPLRGHSNVQGIGSVGFTPHLKEEIFNNLEKKLGIKIPEHKGYDTMACMEAAERAEMDFAFLLGGNLYASNPDLNYAEKALNRIPFKVFLNTTLNIGHLHGVDQEVLILPVAARDEENIASTQESMFNFVRLSDGGIYRLNNVRPEIDIIRDMATDLIPKERFDFTLFNKNKTIRESIAAIIPGYEKLKDIDNSKEEFTIEGRHLESAHFKTKSGKALFKIVNVPEFNSQRKFRLMSIRSEGQFNSIVYENYDLLRKKAGRYDILMHPDDMRKLSIKKGERLRLVSDLAESTEFTVMDYPIKEGNIAAYYPEINQIIPRNIDPRSKTPAFKHVAVDVYKL
jgi:anaerobic selenocysteine-containing dehydrogenase